MTYILSVLSARFQLENWSAPARLGSAWNLHSSAQLELENSSSNSSLLPSTYLCARKFKCNYTIWLNIRFSHLLQRIEEMHEMFTLATQIQVDVLTEEGPGPLILDDVILHFVLRILQLKLFQSNFASYFLLHIFWDWRHSIQTYTEVFVFETFVTEKKKKGTNPYKPKRTFKEKNRW